MLASTGEPSELAGAHRALTLSDGQLRGPSRPELAPVVAIRRAGKKACSSIRADARGMLELRSRKALPQRRARTCAPRRRQPAPRAPAKCSRCRDPAARARRRCCCSPPPRCAPTAAASATRAGPRRPQRARSRAVPARRDRTDLPEHTPDGARARRRERRHQAAARRRRARARPAGRHSAGSSGSGWASVASAHARGALRRRAPARRDRPRARRRAAADPRR